MDVFWRPGLARNGKITVVFVTADRSIAGALPVTIT